MMGQNISLKLEVGGDNTITTAHANRTVNWTTPNKRYACIAQLFLVNPRRACTARVFLVTISVCLFHQYLICWTSSSQNEDIDIDYTCESRHKIIVLCEIRSPSRYDNFHLFHIVIHHFLHVRRSHAYISYEYLYSGVDNGDRRG